MPHTSHADVIFEWEHKLYRCQVKTVTHIEDRKKNWRFDLRKGITTTGRHYKKDQIDIIAMVNLEYQTVCFKAFSDCKTTQITIKDEIMKSINSVESLKEAMESIILATNGRQDKNESTSGTKKTAING
jgi:adenine-specific DNA methylase